MGVRVLLPQPKKGRRATTPKGFWQAVHDDPQLEYLGVHDDEVFVRGPRHTFAAPPSEILIGQESDLLPVLREERMPTVLYQVSRIVGYFSSSQNWNRSKLAEQRDRRRGTYALTGDLPAREPLPDLVMEAIASTGARMACEVPTSPGDGESPATPAPNS